MTTANQSDYILTNDLDPLRVFVDDEYHTFPSLPEQCVSIAPYTDAKGVVQCVKTGGHRSPVHRARGFSWDDRLSTRGALK